jgi:hypothetical protein
MQQQKGEKKEIKWNNMAMMVYFDRRWIDR